MKALLTGLLFIPVMTFAQVSYTVTITRLKATADPCDGGGIIPFVCPSAPQDPVFNIWSSDAEANENHYCWVFDGDPEIEYNLWKDIQNVEIAAVNNVQTSYISFDMSGFESDALTAPTCSSSIGDDEIYERQFVHQFLLSNIPEGSPFLDVIDLGGIYYAEVSIVWNDLTSGLSENETPSFNLFPNPNNGSFTIRDAEWNDLDEVLIYDLAGKVVGVLELTGVESVFTLQLLPGIYFVSIPSLGRASDQRLVIK